jgi:hypothetical protein
VKQRRRRARRRAAAPARRDRDDRGRPDALSGDVLVENGRISAVGANLVAGPGVAVIDVAGAGSRRASSTRTHTSVCTRADLDSTADGTR